jgi:hypothetical protein
MATTQTTLVESKFLENIQTDQYVANNVKAIVDAAVLSNSGTSGVFVSVNIVPESTTTSTANRFIPNRYFAPGDTYSCPELVGQILRSGAKISTIASAASTITFRVSGREIS